MAGEQRSNVNGNQSLGYVLVALILMLALIAVAFLSPKDAGRKLDLTVRDISNATLGVPEKQVR